MPDPMTGLEILDDAVKIGLGAAIGLVGAKLSHAREWQTERSSRRIATLEKTAFDLAAVAIIYWNLEATVATSCSNSRCDTKEV